MEKEQLIFGKMETIHSEILDEDRPLLIHLPEGYEKSEELYPVVYLLNGGYKARFANTAATIQLLSDGGQGPSMIVVGIKDIQHARDFFPIPINGRGGEADNFLRFLIEELIPYIESNYRAASYRILMGASNSGLFTVYTLLTKPDAFNAYLAISPMIGWNPEFISDKAEEYFKMDAPSNNVLFISYGSDDYERVIEHVPKFAEMLVSDAPHTLSWNIEIIENDGHVPVPSLHNSLKFIFPNWAFPASQSLEAGLEGIKTYYDILSQKYGFEVLIPESILDDLGYELLVKGDMDDAITVLRFCIGIYPNSLPSYHLLGIAYEKTERNKLAVECFEKVLEIDPTKIEIQEKIVKLKQEHDN
jgi:hypothetical protein